MKKFLLGFVFCTMSFSSVFAGNETKYYGTGLCSEPGYYCIKVKAGQNWQKLFPDPEQRDLVQRLNRTNMHIWAGKEIVVPTHLDQLSIYDISPFPKKIPPSSGKLIIVDQEKLAWGAYNRKGELVKWGPISSGKNYCPDVHRVCTTRTGIYYVFNKKDVKCISTVFPVEDGGGAKMPYCMFFYRGYALHGSHEVPGYRDSHGCVRLFTEDAKWLNENFVELSTKENNFKGTKVIIQELTSFKGLDKNAKAQEEE